MKKLDRADEEFFQLCLLMYGPPDPRARDYIFNQFERGAPAYIKHDPRGRRFLQCVVECGEAKSRAGKWYYRYVGWYRKREQL